MRKYRAIVEKENGRFEMPEMVLYQFEAKDCLEACRKVLKQFCFERYQMLEDNELALVESGYSIFQLKELFKNEDDTAGYDWLIYLVDELGNIVYSDFDTYIGVTKDEHD